MTDNRFIILWTIYQRPKDYPKGYVVRRHYAMADGSVKYDTKAWVADTLEEIRAGLPPGLRNIGRHDSDNPAILEVWI